MTYPNSIIQGTIHHVNMILDSTKLGKPPYFYRFYIDNIEDKTMAIGPTRNISYTKSRIFNESTSIHKYKGEVVDSCPIPNKDSKVYTISIIKRKR